MARSRPVLIDDAWGVRLRDPVSGTYVGVPGPRGRERVVSALPVRELRVYGPILTDDPWGVQLRDPVSGYYVGRRGYTLVRMLSAGWTQDTRGI